MPSGTKTTKKVADKKIPVVDSPESLIASTVMENAGANITKAAADNHLSQASPGTAIDYGNGGGGGTEKPNIFDSPIAVDNRSSDMSRSEGSSNDSYSYVSVACS